MCILIIIYTYSKAITPNYRRYIMSFAQVAQSKIQSAQAYSVRETQRQLKLQQQKDRQPFDYYHSLVDLIKQKINDISNSESDIETNKKLEIFICETRKLNNHYSYDHSQFNEPFEFFTHFSRWIPKNEFTDLKSFLEQEDIKALYIYSAHDGIGMESWNNIYAKI